MPRGSAELTNAREEEIIDACGKLYETMSFKEITIKEIGKETTFTRTSIYNYFQTKEEIFLALLRREYAAWNRELRAAVETVDFFSRGELAGLLADTLSRRGVLLKILSMNLYEIEGQSRLEKLIEFKREFCATMDVVNRALHQVRPALSKERCVQFLYSFFPFVYGVYPYTSITEKQDEAMKRAGIAYQQYSVYELVEMTAAKLLEA
jgi:AcrR family transcriptional regulator